MSSALPFMLILFPNRLLICSLTLSSVYFSLADRAFFALGKHGYNLFATSSSSHSWNSAYSVSGVMLK